MKARLFLFLTMTLATPSAVLADDWDWGVSPYLWAAGINGGVTAGSLSADTSVDFGDIVNVLQGGALLRLEGTSGQNGVFGDIVYLALEEENAKDTVGGTLEVDLDNLIVEAGYRRSITSRFAIDVGVRYWDFKTKLTPAVQPSVRRSSDWTDGFIGARFSNALSDKWQWVLRANIGAGGSDLALGVDLDFRRELANGNQLTVGFRALDVDFSDSSGAVPVELNMTFSGLTIGYTFNL